MIFSVPTTYRHINQNKLGNTPSIGPIPLGTFGTIPPSIRPVSLGTWLLGMYSHTGTWYVGIVWTCITPDQIGMA